MEFLQAYFRGWSGEVVFATLVCWVLSRFLYRKRSDIPMANGRYFPLLGHALAYKVDPALFLQCQSNTVFRINLAGREMIVVSDARAMKQVATLPETAMSARQAVADIGFEYTLGLLNVHKGTDWHKRILKDYIYNNKENAISTIFQFLVAAVDKETMNNDDKHETNNSVVAVNDLFTFVRRIMLRTMLTYMIAPGILDEPANEQFLNDFMDYQDMVEDATAKAAVLPRFISIPFILKPVQQRREELTLQLASMIGCIWKNCDDIGPWLTAFQNDCIGANEAAELTLGLLFAAHKNPAIGAAQSFCYLQTEATAKQQQTAAHEATSMCGSFSEGMQPATPESLRHCVLETLRLTAHSIGGVRTAQKNIVLETSGGQTYSIRKNYVIAISHITTHRDPSIWGLDALNYRQDRWEKRKENTRSMGVPVDEYKYTTFSQGVHKCPGEGLALSMMEMMLAILLVRNAKLVDKEHLPNVSFERATLAQRDGKVPITIGAVTAT